MIEIRPITAVEAPRFLRILCDVFNLDYDRAASVFFMEPFFDLGNKWALFVAGEMVSILTLTNLTFGWGRAVGIAGVATVPSARRLGHGRQLLDATLAQAQSRGIAGAVLFAHRTELYAASGFDLVDHVIRAPVHALPFEETLDHIPQALDTPEVQRLYSRWSEASPGRLRRDARRWQLWNWGLRTCEPFGNGYLCHEASLVREAIFSSSTGAWPVIEGSDWVGLASLTRELDIPLAGPPVNELLVMTKGFSYPLEMFMTDQF